MFVPIWAMIAVWAACGFLGWVNAINRWNIGLSWPDRLMIGPAMILGPFALCMTIFRQQEPPI